MKYTNQLSAESIVSSSWEDEWTLHPSPPHIPKLYNQQALPPESHKATLTKLSVTLLITLRSPLEGQQPLWVFERKHLWVTPLEIKEQPGLLHIAMLAPPLPQLQTANLQL